MNLPKSFKKIYNFVFLQDEVPTNYTVESEAEVSEVKSEFIIEIKHSSSLPWLNFDFGFFFILLQSRRKREGIETRGRMRGMNIKMKLFNQNPIRNRRPKIS